MTVRGQKSNLGGGGDKGGGGLGKGGGGRGGRGGGDGGRGLGEECGLCKMTFTHILSCMHEIFCGSYV